MGSGELVDEPERISQYTKYFDTMRELALPHEAGDALLREQIDRLRAVEET
jgi:hypothetical protein